MDDHLKGQIASLLADRELALAALERLRSGTRREKLGRGEVLFRQADLVAMIDRIEVDESEVRITGRKDVLEQSVLATGGHVQGFTCLPANGAP